MSFDSTYYLAMQNRTRTLLSAIGMYFSEEEIKFYLHLVDANEFGVVLEMVGDSLFEKEEVLEPAVAREFVDLATEVGVPETVAWVKQQIPEQRG